MSEPYDKKQILNRCPKCGVDEGELHKDHCRDTLLAEIKIGLEQIKKENVMWVTREYPWDKAIIVKNDPNDLNILVLGKWGKIAKNLLERMG
jgi:hypothetical protein